MHGLVHRSIRSLVVKTAGTPVWEEILQKIGSDSSAFLSIQAYSDEQTHRLIGQVCATLGLSLETALTAVGRHWVSFVLGEGYGPMLQLFGPDFRSCLRSLDQMHSHMGHSMSGISFPRFRVLAEDPKEMMLEYRSKRAGMFPFLLGLLEGLAEFYQEKVELKALPKPSDGADNDRVQIRFVA